MSTKISNGRTQESGRLAVHKHDFNVHVQGTDFNHTADNILMNPVITAYNNVFNGANVQEILEQIANVVAEVGQGFITIGDGYDTGNYTVGDPATPTLQTAFNAAFEDPRLQNGGWILIKAGTYVLTSTVTIPAGISIMGEVAGTSIIGQMLEQPMFKISRGDSLPGIGGDTGGGPVPLDAGAPTDRCKFWNLALYDNLNGVVKSGLDPIASMSTVPMIQCEISSNFECEGVSFFGRINNQIAPRSKTFAAISYVNGGGTGTRLTLERCYFDGMEIAVSFQPGNGNIDYLTVNHCRARTFGKENPGTPAAVDNCFVNMTACNAVLTNNYHFGGASLVNACFAIASAGGSLDNIKMVMVGNAGRPGSVVNNANFFVDASGSSTPFLTVKSGNNWGNSINNEWFLVVSPGTQGSASGDINGARAIDTVLNLATSSSAMAQTIIVNPGVYTVNGDPAQIAGLKFIGNKKGASYPEFQLDIATGSLDVLGNEWIMLGSYLKSIKFTSTSSAHSIRMSWGSSHTVEIDDCLFDNTALLIEPIAATVETPAVRTNVLIKNCHFFQDNTFEWTASCVAPPASSVVIENCIFRSSGYFGGIGSFGTYTSVSQTNPSYTIRNVTIDLTGGTSLDVGSPTGFNNVFYIQDSAARVLIENCQMLASNTYAEVTPIHSSLTADATYNKFINISAKSLVVLNSVFNGPHQTFTTGGSTFAMPTMYVHATQSVKIDKSRFMGGALPLQISGANAFSDTGARDALQITDSEFAVASGSTTVTTTLLDVDVDLNSFTVAAHLQPQMVFRGNTFYQNIASGMTQVQHTERTGSTYNGQGIVQVYAPFFDVVFIDNKISGRLRQFGTFATPYRYYAGLVIDNYNSNTLGSGSTDTPFVVNVSNNSIKCYNFFETNSSADAAAVCALVRSTVLHVHDNHMNMNNQATTGGMTQFTGCLYVDNQVSTDVTYSDGLVTGNTFARRDDSGTQTSLVRGYVLIPAAAGRGMIVYNSFSDATFDGSSTALVEDNAVTANKWIVSGNKNQTETLVVRGNIGMIGLGLTSTGHKVVTGAISGVAVSSIRFDTNSAVTNITFDYEDTTVDETCIWSMPIYGIVPHGAYLTNVSVGVDVSANPTTQSIAALTIRDVNSSTNDTENPVTTSGATLTLSPTQNTRVSLPGNATSIEITFRVLGNSALDATIGPLSITYRW